MLLAQEKIPLRLATTYALAQIALPALLSNERIDFKQMRPDEAYSALLQDRVDVALVLDNAPWKGVIAIEIGRGYFQLYAKAKRAPFQSILLPEDQMEVLNFLQSWNQVYGTSPAVKLRVPSWSLIASICAGSKEVGFLPDFLGKRLALYPVSWQPAPLPYRILATYKSKNRATIERLKKLTALLSQAFA